MDSLGPRPYTFIKGYTDDKKNTQYMNMGYGSSTYPGKIGHGDYGPPQGGEEYYNPKPLGKGTNYPYPLDFSPAVSRIAQIQAGYSDNVPEYIIKAIDPAYYSRR